MSEQSAMFEGEEILQDDDQQPEEPDGFWDHSQPSEAPSTPDASDVDPYPFQCLSDIQAKTVDWLWHQRIPRGMITVIEGHPSTGKSSVIMDLVARMTTGEPFPGDNTAREPMNILWITQEDDPACVLKPRLLAAKGDPTRFFVQTEIDVLGGNNVTDAERKTRWARITATIEAVQPQVLIMDPGSVTLEDGNSETITRQVMGRLWKLGQDEGFTTLWIRHLAKNSADRDAWAAGIGSVGVTAQARSQLQLATDFSAMDEDHDYPRIIQQVKSNLGPHAPTLQFGIRFIKVQDGDVEVETSEVCWGGETDRSLASLQSSRGGKAGSKLKDARVQKLEEWCQKKKEFTMLEAATAVDGVGADSVKRYLRQLGCTFLKDRKVWRYGEPLS